MTSPSTPLRTSPRKIHTADDIDSITLLNDTVFPLDECLKKVCLDRNCRQVTYSIIPTLFKVSHGQYSP
jgi:hypothetical protein